MNCSVLIGIPVRTRWVVLLLAILLVHGDSDAQVMGALDPDFGLVQVDVAPGSADHANSLAVQADGKIVLGGMARVGTNSQVSLLRFLPNGVLDGTFGDGGIRLHDLGGSGERCVTVLVQTDGRLLAIGDLLTDVTQGFVARYLPDGSLDDSYGENGVRMFRFDQSGNSTINDAALRPDGRLVIAGTYANGSAATNMAVAQLTLDGDFDLSFNGNGVQVLPSQYDRRAFSVVLSPEGGVVLGGSVRFGLVDTRTCLTKLSSNGEVDLSFGSEGTVLLPMDSEHSEANDLHITSTGGILVGGTRNTDPHDIPFTTKLLPDGAPDPAYPPFGLWTYSATLGGSLEMEAIAVQSDGSIVGCGIMATSHPFFISLFRRTTTGGVDQTFGNQSYGWLYPDLDHDFLKGDLALLPDGSILVAGGFVDADLNGVTFLMKCVNNPELGMQNRTSAPDILVQPIPFTDHITISGSLAVDSYVIRDVLGRDLKQGKLYRSTEDGSYHMREIPPMLASPLTLHLYDAGRFVAGRIILQE